MGFQHRNEAEQFLHQLRERFDKFGLALHPDKTRLIEFGRFAAKNRQRRQERKPETFDFLGFTHCCGRKFQTGRFHVRRKTVKKRLRAKLQAVKQTLLRRRHEPIQQQGRWLCSVLRGYYLFHAIPGNLRAMAAFQREVTRTWLVALRCRSQRSRLNWMRFRAIASRWIPAPKVLHPYPNDRFYAKHPK